MHQFKDCKGRAWDVEINVWTVKRVNDLLKIDLDGIIGDNMEPLDKLTRSFARLIDVIYVLCKSQADKAQVTDEDFGRSMAGQALEDAAEAFMLELSDYFPPSGGKKLRQLLAKGKQAVELIREELQEKIDQLDVKTWAEMLKKSSGGASASSASNPGPSPFENSALRQLSVCSPNGTEPPP